MGRIHWILVIGIILPGSAIAQPADERSCVCDESVPLAGHWNGRIVKATLGSRIVSNPSFRFEDLEVQRLDCGNRIRVIDREDSFVVTATRGGSKDSGVHYEGVVQLEGGVSSTWHFFGAGGGSNLARALQGTIDAGPYLFDFTMERSHGPMAERPLQAQCKMARKLLAEAKAMRNAFADKQLVQQAIDARRPAFDTGSDWIDASAWQQGDHGILSDLNRDDGTYYDRVISEALDGKTSATTGALSSTDPNSCEIDLDRESLKEECYPDAAIAAIEAHEKLHQKTCRRLVDDFPRTGEISPESIRRGWFNHPANLSSDEAAAYEVTIDRIAPWIRQNCGG